MRNQFLAQWCPFNLILFGDNMFWNVFNAIVIPIACISVGVALWKNRLTTLDKFLITTLLFGLTLRVFQPFVLDRQTMEIPKSNTSHIYSPNSPYYQG
jgi:hypothetical protein